MKPHLFLAASLVALFQTPLAAQSANGATAEDRDETIIVTAMRRAQTIDEAVLSVSVIDKDALDVFPGRTLDDVLRNVPGVQLPLSNQNTNFPANPSIAIRGLGLGDNGTRTLVLIDGAPANGGFFGNVYWNRTPIDGVERVEIVRGGGSGVYGAFAQGGVVNIITTKPADEFSLFAEGRGGSFDTYGGDVVASGSVTDRLRLGVSASYDESDGFFEVIEEQRGLIDTRTAYENESYRGQIEFDATEDVTVFVRGGYYDQDQGGTSVLAQTATEVEDVVAGLTASFGRSRIESRFFFQSEEFLTVNPRANDARSDEFISFASASESDDFGGSFVWTYEPAGILTSISLGLDARVIDGENRALTFLPDETVFLNESNFGKQRSIGIFAEATLAPFAGNEITINVREDFYRNGDAIEIENGARSSLPTNKLEEFSFRAATTQEVTEHLLLRGAAYRSFRAPTLAELYRSFGSSSFQGRANPLLEAETLIGGEIGARLSDETGRSLDVTFFTNTIDSFVGGVPVAFFPVFTLENTNLGKIRSRGIETIGQAPIGEYLRITAGYTFLDTEVTENPLNTDLLGNHIEGAPRHSVTWGFTLSDWRGVTVDLRGRHLAEQFQDIGNQTRLGSHTVVDASVNYAVNETTELFVIGENIFDEEYEASAFGGLIQRGAPATVTGGVRLRF